MSLAIKVLCAICTFFFLIMLSVAVTTKDTTEAIAWATLVLVNVFVVVWEYINDWRKA